MGFSPYTSLLGFGLPTTAPGKKGPTRNPDRLKACHYLASLVSTRHYWYRVYYRPRLASTLTKACHRPDLQDPSIPHIFHDTQSYSSGPTPHVSWPNFWLTGSRDYIQAFLLVLPAVILNSVVITFTKPRYCCCQAGGLSFMCICLPMGCGKPGYLHENICRRIYRACQFLVIPTHY